MPPAPWFSLLLVGLSLPVAAVAEPLRSEVEVTMFAVSEDVWRNRFDGQFPEHPVLWLRLNGDAAAGRVEMPVDFKFRLVGEEAVVQRKGMERQFGESWQAWHHSDFRAHATQTTSRFIGTTVELAQMQAPKGIPLRLTLKFEHHIAPPTMKRFNYANAATGAERDRLSVEYPQFEKLEWGGELAVWREWRLVANVLHLPVIAGGDPAVPPRRFLVFIKRA